MSRWSRVRPDGRAWLAGLASSVFDALVRAFGLSIDFEFPALAKSDVYPPAPVSRRAVADALDVLYMDDGLREMIRGTSLLHPRRG